MKVGSGFDAASVSMLERFYLGLNRAYFASFGREILERQAEELSDQERRSARLLKDVRQATARVPDAVDLGKGEGVPCEGLRGKSAISDAAPVTAFLV